MTTILSYKQYVKPIKPIKEGGRAVAGVTTINQENSMATIDAIVKNFLPLLKITKKDIAILGSTGKKAPKGKSGDIDLALSATALLDNNKINSFDEILNAIADASKKLGYAYTIMKGIGIVSVAFPIVNKDGEQPNDKVQLDFMVVDNVKYAEWSYFSPSYLQSTLKGLYRNEINYAVAKHAGLEVTRVDPETKTTVEWKRFLISLGQGLLKGTQTNLSPKTGKITKTARYIEKKLVTDNPDEVVKFLYGDTFIADDILTFEQALDAILSPKFPHRKHIKNILAMVSKGIQDKGYPVPESLARHL